VSVPWSVRKMALHRWLQKDKSDEEVVVLLKGLGHQCALYYDTSTMRILDYFNGKKVRSMRDLVTYALESEMMKEEYMRITFSPLADKDLAGSSKDPDIVLQRQWCETADADVMKTYNIERLASPDVAEYYHGVEAALQKNMKQVRKTSFMQVESEQFDRRVSPHALPSAADSDPFGLVAIDPDAVNDIVAAEDVFEDFAPLEADMTKEVDVRLHDHANEDVVAGEAENDDASSRHPFQEENFLLQGSSMIS